MTKVLFVLPPFYRFLGSHNNWINMGASILAEILHEKGYEVKVYNADFVASNDYPNQLELYLHTRKSMEVFASGLIYDEVLATIKEFNPDVLCLSLVTGTAYAGLEIARRVKAELGVKIVVGGPFVTFNLDEVMNLPYIDCSVVGEGEKVIEEAITSNQRVICGEEVEDLDALPLITRERLLRAVEPQDFNAVLTSRGCKNSCIFCSSPALWKHSVKFRSVQSVLAELAFRKNTYGTQKFYFIDDSFLAFKERALELCRGIQQLDVHWWCESTFRDVDAEVLQAAKDAGCLRIKLGLEIASDPLLKRIGKNITLPEIEAKIQLVKSFDLNFTLYLLLGIPGATEQDYLDTLEFARKMDATYYSVSIAVPYKGTGLYNLMTDKLEGAKITELFHTNYNLIKFWGISDEILDAYLNLNQRADNRRLD